MEWNKTTFGLTFGLLCHIFGGHNQKTTSFFFLLTRLFFSRVHKPKSMMFDY